MYPYKKVPAWFCEYESKNPIGLFRHMCWGFVYNKGGEPHCYMISGKAVIFVKDAREINVWPRWSGMGELFDGAPQ
jgi:hypothetical protein